MSKQYEVKEFGNSLHIILPKNEFSVGDIVAVTKDKNLHNRLTELQRLEVQEIIQDALCIHI